MIYLSVFLSAFIAATLLPAFSELALAGAISAGYVPLYLWLAATVGNSLGACVNWWLGGELLRWRDKKWFPVKPEALARAQQQFQRYGSWSLLLAWLPIVGDPLTFVAGVLRVPFWQFVLLVTLGKGARYALVLWLVIYASN